MVARLHIDGTDIVISKAGHDASNPALADANKVFDSDWLFGGNIIERKAYIFPRVSGAHTYVMPFSKTYSFVPLVLCFAYCPAGGRLFFESEFQDMNGPTLLRPDSARVYTDRVEKSYSSTPDFFFTLGGSDNYHMGWYYIAFAI